MTVGELIARLQTLNQDSLVYLNTDDSVEVVQDVTVEVFTDEAEQVWLWATEIG